MTTLMDLVKLEHKIVTDERGELKVVQFDSNFPFIPKRIFTISNVPYGEQRGGHAHRVCHQIIMVVSGALDLVLKDGMDTLTLRAAQNSELFWIKPGIWVEMMNFTNDCAILVFCSHCYEGVDYIHEFSELREYNFPKNIS